MNMYVMLKSLWQAVVGTWRMLTTHLGHIRVDFAQPLFLTTGLSL